MLKAVDDQGTHRAVRERQRDETRKRLYHAALEIFARDGVAQCRIEDIAQKAEVSRAAFYFHFPSKDDVLLEVLNNAETPITEAVNDLPADATLRTVFDTLISGMAKFWSDEPHRKLLVDVFAVSLRRAPVLSDREAEIVRMAVGKRFQVAATKGELSTVVPAEVLADFFLLNCLAAMASWCVQPTGPLATMLEGVTHLFMHGAGPKKG